MKKAGILMPVASIPSRHGCGSFGKEAYHFVDLAKQAGLSVWQILPLNPLGYGNSPYQPYSSYAMDDLYISLDRLKEIGLIKRDIPAYNRNTPVIDYDAVRVFREPFLKEAYSNFTPDLNYSTFSYQDWVKNFAIFMMLKKKNGMRCWLDWTKEEKNQPVDGKFDLKPYEDEILYEVFKQYMLFLQWKDLKQYANDLGIEIMGDIPFYVGIDSADVWSQRQNFLLDDDGRPTFIAGVPPDYFSATGQRWGNPIYDWDYMEKDDFGFWAERISYTQKLFDIIRVDHFRAFDTFWKIKASCPTAIEGEWIEAPGYKLFDTVLKKTEDLQMVAEDLGDLRKEVHVLRDHYKFRGMRVIQFAFIPDESDVKDREHLLTYTGTHDNDAILAWYRELPQAQRRKIRRYLKSEGYTADSFSENVLRYAMNQQSDMVIIPMCDWLHKNRGARLNKPGTVGSPNWEWRLTSFAGFAKALPFIRAAVEEGGRLSAE